MLPKFLRHLFQQSKLALLTWAHWAYADLRQRKSGPKYSVSLLSCQPLSDGMQIDQAGKIVLVFKMTLCKNRLLEGRVKGRKLVKVSALNTRKMLFLHFGDKQEYDYYVCCQKVLLIHDILHPVFKCSALVSKLGLADCWEWESIIAGVLETRGEKSHPLQTKCFVMCTAPKLAIQVILIFLNLLNGSSHVFTWLSLMTSGYGICLMLLVGIKK